MSASVDADHKSKGAAPSGFDAGKGVLHDDSAGGLNSQPASGFEEHCRIGFPGKSQLRGEHAVDPLVE